MKKQTLALVLKAEKIGDIDVVKSEYVEYLMDQEESFKQAYEIIGTDVVELVQLDNNIGVIVDEVGLIKSGNHVIEFSIGFQEFMYAGNLIFVSLGEEDLEPLTEEQVLYLVEKLKYYDVVRKYTI